MNKNPIQSHDDDSRFQLTDNQVLTFDARKVEIDCLQGLIWVTWPDGNDRVLQKGQSMSVNSGGLICIQAFTASSIITNTVKKGDLHAFSPKSRTDLFSYFSIGSRQCPSCLKR